VPRFEMRGKTFENPVELALDVIGGKWKMPILWRLHQRVHRYNELQRSLGAISPKMLTQQLRELEADGLVHRKVHPEVPPRVEYSITERGRSAMPVVHALRDWGIAFRRAEDGGSGPRSRSGDG
jgi:DNA-binding HxlR family transcriptional regulator